ncbi:MAG: nitroreductase family protein [Eubacteriales bacterium]
MITVDWDKCNGCGVCIRRFAGYCISSQNNRPIIDQSLCNQCQKCVAICPAQAFLTNNTPSQKINGVVCLPTEDLKELLAQRRSVKKFTTKKVPDDVLRQIAGIASYAPNQNKNIDIVVINNADLLGLIDNEALAFVGGLYRWLFGVKPLAFFMGLFSNSVSTIKKKMEYDLYCNKHIVKENTSALFLAIGNPKVPVTKESAHYLLGTMIVYAQALGIGTCLMDSIRLSINNSRRLRYKINIPAGWKVLGALAAGYSNENIINKPVGYEVNVHWNNVDG